MKPTIGRIVIYKTNQADRELFRDLGDNIVMELPAIIVNVWSDTCVNLKVITDGKLDLWRMSINQGDGEYNWNWPVIKA